VLLLLLLSSMSWFGKLDVADTSEKQEEDEEEEDEEEEDEEEDGEAEPTGDEEATTTAGCGGPRPTMPNEAAIGSMVVDDEVVMVESDETDDERKPPDCVTMRSSKKVSEPQRALSLADQSLTSSSSPFQLWNEVDEVTLEEWSLGESLSQSSSSSRS